MKWLLRLHDHRLLPFFVAFSMVMGILIGKAFGISQYELTPPITAITAILRGSYEFTIGNSLALGVVVGLFLMMYPSMTNVRFEELGKAFRSPRQLLVVVFFNFAIWPFLMWALAKLFLSGDPDFYTGLVLYGIAPCIAMVIVFTYLAQGNVGLALALVAYNSVLQMLLLPVYTKLLLGSVPFDVWLVAESVALYLGLPLVMGFLTRRIGISRLGEARFEQFRQVLHTLSIVGLLFTLVVMFGLKGDAIVETPLMILKIAVPITLFFVITFNTLYFLGWRLGFSFEDAVACAFNGAGRDFEIAIAIAITAFNPLVALATVVGPLIEVPAMLSLVALARATRRNLFHTTATCPVPAPGCCPEAEQLLRAMRPV
ncbi:MAG: arsenic resistance protein [Chloroflexi bacterium]|nr:arsenic resistance protein [Chloroflexota bacterium]